MSMFMRYAVREVTGMLLLLVHELVYIYMLKIILTKPMSHISRLTGSTLFLYIYKEKVEK